MTTTVTAIPHLSVHGTVALAVTRERKRDRVLVTAVFDPPDEANWSLSVTADVARELARQLIAESGRL